MIDPDIVGLGTALSLGRRSTQIARLQTEHFDVAIVGGGITGAGIALDAASRGLRVALIEKDDFASGTSSRSTKLIHGGLRYLEQMRISLTREALSERHVLHQLAPHLVESIPFLFPIYHRRWEVLRVNTGLWLYDALAGLRRTKLHRQLSRRETLRRIPDLNPDGLRASFVYYDSRTDDARLVVEVLKTAVSYGAAVANYVAGTGLRRAGRQACGIEAVDVLTGQSIEIDAAKVVVAAGVWLDQVFPSAEHGDSRRVRPAKGVHLIVSSERMGYESAVVFPTPDKRLMFVTPWQGATLIGTTDTDYDGELDRPRASRADVDYIFDVVNQAFPRVALTDDDVISVQAGLRPLVDSGEGTTAKVSREDRVFEDESGVIAIAGGKLTTYRRMGRKVVDLVVRRLSEEHLIGRKVDSRTRDVALGGLPSRPRRRFGRRRRQSRVAPPLAADFPRLSAETIRHLWNAYGQNWSAVADLALTGDLNEPIVAGLPAIRAEIVFAARHEMALTLCDALARRTHVALLNADQVLGEAPDLAQLMASELGWDEREIARRVVEYQEQIAQFSIAPLRR